MSAHPDVALLEELAEGLRRAGVSHYDGRVPGWPLERDPVKLILGPAAPASAPPTPDRPRLPKRAMTPAELDAAVLGHVAIHGDQREKVQD